MFSFHLKKTKNPIIAFTGNCDTAVISCCKFYLVSHTLRFHLAKKLLRSVFTADSNVL